MNLNDHVKTLPNEEADSKESQIIFTPSSEKPWLMKLTIDGIIFNREGYPSLDADEFAREFVTILQNLFTVEIKRKI